MLSGNIALLFHGTALKLLTELIFKNYDEFLNAFVNVLNLEL